MIRLIHRLVLSATLALATGAAAPAQELWEGAGVPGLVATVEEFYTDTVNDLFYAVGVISRDSVQGGNDFTLVRYDGEHWDTLGTFWYFARSILTWHDTLLVGGSIDYANGELYQNLIGYANGDWFGYGAFDTPIHALRIIDGQLYAVGTFHEVDGQAASGIAKRVGDHWEPVGHFEDLSVVLVDLISYQGDLIACGAVSPNGMENGGIIRYDAANDTWVPFGGGIHGGGGISMAVYKGELYLGGYFPIGPNAGKSIMRWNGSQWRNLGVGPQVINGSYQYDYQMAKLLVHDDKLFVCGGFLYASGVPAQMIATYDSLNWCGFTGEFPNGGPSTIGFYHDTLYYAQTQSVLWGDTVNKVLRFLGEHTYADTCGGLQVGVSETHLAPLPPALFHPGEERITWEFPASSPVRQVTLLNALGQAIASQRGRWFAFHTQGLTEGVYLLRLEDGGTQRVVVHR